jgi:hypothetical protein
MPRRRTLYLVLAAGLAAVATLSTLVRPVNPAALPTGLAVSTAVESSALYCTGLSDAPGGVQGDVVFLNTRAPERAW